MSWAVAGQFALWTAALLVIVLIVVFCAAGIVAMYEDHIAHRYRLTSRLESEIKGERANRKHQNHELRLRMRRLEAAVKELNPGLDI